MNQYLRLSGPAGLGQKSIRHGSDTRNHQAAQRCEGEHMTPNLAGRPGLNHRQNFPQWTRIE